MQAVTRLIRDEGNSLEDPHPLLECLIAATANPNLDVRLEAIHGLGEVRYFGLDRIVAPMLRRIRSLSSAAAKAVTFLLVMGALTAGYLGFASNRQRIVQLGFLMLPGAAVSSLIAAHLHQRSRYTRASQQLRCILEAVSNQEPQHIQSLMPELRRLASPVQVQPPYARRKAECLLERISESSDFNTLPLPSAAPDIAFGTLPRPASARTTSPDSLPVVTS